MRVITVDESTGKRVFSRKEVATLCGVSAQTIRLWEDSKLIPASTRDENDYRYWDEDALVLILEYSKNPIKCGRKKKSVE
jgi:DNA-binding transcriptional MerR regulator